jgi:hypothetical protein
MKPLEKLIGPVTYLTIDKHAWNHALDMVMSTVPPPDFYESSLYESACEEFMDADSDGDWPEDFVVWQPFENWDLGDIQELVEEFRDSLMIFASQTLLDTGVITNE